MVEVFFNDISNHCWCMARWSPVPALFASYTEILIGLIHALLKGVTHTDDLLANHINIK